MTRKKAHSVILCFILGLVFGLFAKYVDLFSFDFEISVFDAFQLAVTAFLACWVVVKLEKDSAIERCEKDILIEKLKVLEDIISHLKPIAVNNEIVLLSDVVTQIGAFDMLSNKVIDIMQSRYPSLLSNQDNDYRTDMADLDDLFTNDQIESMSDSILIENKNGITTCVYAPFRLDAIVSKLSDISNKLFNLQILLNRA